MLPARSARRLRRILIVFYTTTITISLSLSLSSPFPLSPFLSFSSSLSSSHHRIRDDKDTQNAKRRRNTSKWIERVEFAGFDAWEESWQ